jgi:hypothetical protein
VLGIALAELEYVEEDCGNTTPDTNGFCIPLSSGSVHKFDGAHPLFTWHEGVVIPEKQLRVAASGGGSASRKETKQLKAKLVAVEAWAQEHEVELEEARMAAAADLEDSQAAAAEELADAQDAAESELSRERAELQ